MNEFDKADVLRERANVSFEEARDALKACGGDLLDAYVYLEKLGHIKNSERKDTPDPVPVSEMSSYSPAPASKPEGPSFWSWLGHTLGTLLKKSTENYLVISHEGVVKSATSGAFIKKYSLDSASSVQSAIKGLNDKEIISNTGDGTRIYDYFFAWWLKDNY